MGKKKIIPEYSTVTINGHTYFRKRITDSDGEWVSIYGKTAEEVYRKTEEAKELIEEAIYRKENPTVKDYCEKWLNLHSAQVRETTMVNYRYIVNNYIIAQLGDFYIADVTPDDVRMALLPASKKSHSVYRTANMLIKSIFKSAEENELIYQNPTKNISAKGGKPQKERQALTDEQVKKLLEAIKGLPPYVFVMIGLYAGLRREEILGLKWDCVSLDGETPYISVRRAWHAEHNRPVITTELKTRAASRDIPIPECLAECLLEERKKSKSDFVISNRNGNPLSNTQYERLWKYIVTRSTEERSYYRYVNGNRIKHTVKPVLGEYAPHNGKVQYTLDFKVTPHQLRHTYITNLIYASVDPKTVQYLAGHENSKITMDIYAKVKYNKPKELAAAVNSAFSIK